MKIRVEKQRAEKAGAIVALGIIGYFSIRYYDSIIDLQLPLNIILLIIAAIFLWFMTYYALGIQTK